MPRFNKKSVVYAVLGLGLGVGAVFGALEIERLMKVDAFAVYRKNQAPPAIAVMLKGVSVKTYDGPRLVGKAKIDEVQVGRDRRGLNFIGIREGVFYTDKGTSFKFTAKVANYNTASKMFEATEGARAINRDIDIKAPAFTYSDGENTIRVNGDLTGTYLKGAVQASNLSYNVRDYTFTTGPISWVGPYQATEQSNEPPRKWDIRAESANRVGDVETFMVGRATDGEVIVKADVIRRDVKTDIITATGNVRYFAKDMNLTCMTATVFRRERRAVLEGNVQAFIKPENEQKLEEIELEPLRPIVPPGISGLRPTAPPTKTDTDKKLDDEVRSGENRRKYPIVATAQRIEYWYRRGQRRAVITGDPVAQQDLPGGRWRRMATPLAKWDGEKDLLRGESPAGVRNTFVENSLGDRFVAQWFEVSTKENDDSWSAGGIDGVFTPDDEDLNNRGGSTGGGTGGGGGVTAPPPTDLRGRIGGG